MIVVFGSEPDAFYIGYGRRWSANKMPPVLMEQIQTSVLSPFSTSWLSCSSDCQQFIYRNWVSDSRGVLTGDTVPGLQSSTTTRLTLKSS
ncbi:hypothetical protein BOTBODRAFT_59816 [Botryobasidium botryosum FD-172 SS1]|uniref:Uncharacterized protein n=1 Tax=Botryobasidium botryosum (strain FD-172 SS1) TaxID=930990 RepID=A0A067M7W5_BOTB1|nr:hypothetical protein BOTBODRAFT_59816 [Botryobasidium botryosum FD-172 SS1]